MASTPLVLFVALSQALVAPVPAPTMPTRVVFDPPGRAVSTWRREAAASLLVTPEQAEALRGPGAAPSVARCVKLNNYWCIKKAGWTGEIAADGEGHVAFASAVEGAAVAAILLKRYYVDFDRRSARAIVAHWAPAQCGTSEVGGPRMHARGAKALGGTLRARWLASHARGFVTPIAGRGTKVRRSVVADRVPRPMEAPVIAAGLGKSSRPARPMTLDALLMSTPNAPPSRSMLGMPGHLGGGASLSLGACGDDAARIAAYADKASAGLTRGANDDLGLFSADGAPTPNLATMMGNMAKVEIGPLGATPALIEAGIAEAFRPGRNPTTR